MPRLGTPRRLPTRALSHPQAPRPSVLTGQEPPKPPGPSRLARVLALAHFVERLVDAGDLPDYATAATALGVTRARLSQLLALLLLAARVQDRVLTGELRATERKLRGVVGEAEW